MSDKQTIPPEDNVVSSEPLPADQVEQDLDKHPNEEMDLVDVTPNEEGDPAAHPDETVDEPTIMQDEPTPEEEQPPVEEFSGEHTPNPNVSEPLKVVEELSDAELEQLAKNGHVFLSNYELPDLLQLDGMLRRQIASKQAERREAADKGAAGNYIALEVGRGNIVYMTQAESEAMELVEMYGRTLRYGVGQNIFTDGSKWTNLPSLGDNKIAMGLIDNSASKDPIVVLRHALQLSNEHSVPLWGSGLNLTLEGPGALEQLTLDTKLLLEKIDYGRESSGYVYNASSVYLNRNVADFILNKVKFNTAGIKNTAALKELIAITDLEPLALAGASTLFPQGYELQRPCLTSKGGCGHVIRRKVNLRRMLFVSTSKLSDDALRLMSKRSGHVDVATIKNYQQQMRPDVSRRVKLRNNVEIRLRVPSIADYERIAGGWMDQMSNRAKELIASKANEQERVRYMDRAAGMALLMAYGHWIESFVKVSDEVDAEPVVLVSRLDSSNKEAQYKADEQIDKQLEDLSGDSEMTTIVVEAIEKFIAEMTVSTVAVPKAICPNCRKPVTGDETSAHPHLVNVNPIELFFTLLRHKILLARG